MAQRTRIPATGRPSAPPDLLRFAPAFASARPLRHQRYADPRLDEPTLDHIARELRAHYADLAAQPLPDRLVELMRRLDPPAPAAAPAAAARKDS
jgi:Anti-sigma factor NepR